MNDRNNNVESATDVTQGHALRLAAIVWSPLAVLHLFLSTHWPFHYDEYKTIYNVNHSLGELIRDRLTAGHQPLYFVSAWLWAKIFGDSMFAMRILPQLAGFGAMWFLYLLVRRESNARTGVLAVALCMLSFAFIQICHVARPYTFTLFFALATAYAAMSVGEKPDFKRLAGIAVLTLLLLLTHGSAYPIVGGLIIFLGIRSMFHREALKPMLAIIAAVVVFIPWLMYSLTWINAASRFGWVKEGEWMDIPAAIFGFSFSVDLLDWGTGDSMPKKLIALAMWVGTILCVLFGLSRSRNRTLYVLFWLVPISISAYMLLVKNLNLFNVMRYYSVTVAVQAAAIALAVTWQGWPISIRRVAWILPILLAVAGMARVIEKRHDPKAHNPVDMDVVEYVQENAEDVDVLYVLQNSRLRYQLFLFTGRDVLMLHQVYQIPSSYENLSLGVPRVDPEKGPMDPLPHTNADSVWIIARKSEMAEKDTSVYAIPDELRNRIDEIKAAYGSVTEHVTRECIIYRLEREKSPLESDDQ